MVEKKSIMKQSIIRKEPNQRQSCEKAYICYICKRKFEHIYTNNKKYRDSKQSIPKEIPVIFHNVLSYDYHFIIKELVKAFDGEFNCLRENAKTYKNF